MKREELIDRIQQLKKDKNAVVLAHYYQTGDIQDVADFIGDSLGLSIEAKKTTADIIVFAGVHFMAETAKILNPTKKVLLPDLEAGCSLADSCTPEMFQNVKNKFPNHTVITYVNCSAEIKAMSDIVCTSSNALKIVESIPNDQPILFAPDKNLGAYIVKKTGREMELWEGACVVHEAFSLEKLIKIRLKHPKSKIVAHPESEEQILKYADFIGSTSEMKAFIIDSDREVFIVATEEGILHGLRKEVPNKILIPAPVYEDNSCACGECAFMKVNTLQKLYNCMVNESPEIQISDELIRQAVKPIERMLAIK
ncbi:MAG: quinolinate synthase NadA [Flavobacteriia bacterium]|nr:quinolinate synthase NadA [Flavobacteriia bacterium]